MFTGGLAFTANTFLPGQFATSEWTLVRAGYAHGHTFTDHCTLMLQIPAASGDPFFSQRPNKILSLSHLNSGTDRRKDVIIRMCRIKKKTSQKNPQKTPKQQSNRLHKQQTKSQYFIELPHFYKLERSIQYHKILVNYLL